MADKKATEKKLAEMRPEEFPPDRYTHAYAVTRVFVRLLVPLLGGITVRGGENIPARGPVFLAVNHRAYMDPPYLAMVTTRQLHLMAKEELFKIPLFGPYIKAMGAFPVKRGAADRGAIRQAMDELRAGARPGHLPGRDAGRSGDAAARRAWLRPDRQADRHPHRAHRPGGDGPGASEARQASAPRPCDGDGGPGRHSGGNAGGPCRAGQGRADDYRRGDHARHRRPDDRAGHNPERTCTGRRRGCPSRSNQPGKSFGEKLASPLDSGRDRCHTTPRRPVKAPTVRKCWELIPGIQRSSLCGPHLRNRGGGG